MARSATVATVVTGRPLRLGVLLSHPVQYFSPFWRELGQRSDVALTVYYACAPTAAQQGRDFGVPFVWDVSLLSGYDHRFLRNVARRPGLNFFGCDTPEIAQIVRAREVDVLLVHGWHFKSYCQAIAACRRCRVPIILRADSHLLEPRPVLLRVAREVVHRVLVPQFDAYLSVGPLNEEYCRHFGADASRFFRAGHFVDNAWWSHSVAEATACRDALRRRWNVPDDALTLVFAGKFIPRKRPLELLGALRRLRDAPVHVLMAGDGPLRRQVERIVTEERLPVTLLGFINQSAMPEVYAAGDLLVLPSREESWGMVVNEAMASGLPAIVTDRVGCSPDLIRQGETGTCIPANRADALAEAIRTYLTDRGRVRREGQAARRHIAQFSATNAAEQLLRAANRVCTH